MGAFLQFDLEIVLDQMAETELADPQQARREHRVEDGAGHEGVVFAEQPQIVIRAVDDEFMAGQGFEQRVEVELAPAGREACPPRRC